MLSDYISSTDILGIDGSFLYVHSIHFFYPYFAIHLKIYSDSESISGALMKSMGAKPHKSYASERIYQGNC